MKASKGKASRGAAIGAGGREDLQDKRCTSSTEKVERPPWKLIVERGLEVIYVGRGAPAARFVGWYSIVRRTQLSRSRHFARIYVVPETRSPSTPPTVSSPDRRHIKGRSGRLSEACYTTPEVGKAPAISRPRLPG